MTTNRERRTMIRFALRQLNAQNAGHKFEHLCLALASKTICPNIRPSTGPVGAGGDGGIDFGTFPTLAAKEVGPEGHRLGIESGAKIVFACSLQTGAKPLRQKIKNDVKKIVSNDDTVSHVVYYCEANLPIGHQNSVRKSIKNCYNVCLDIFDGEAIAFLLDRPELSWIATEYLQVPSDVSVSYSDTDDQSLLKFKNTRNIALNRAKELISGALSEHAHFLPDPEIPLLAKPGWILPRPIPLEQVKLLSNEAPPPETLDLSREQLTMYWPTVAGKHIARYSTAVARYDCPGYFFNGTSYRLLDVEASDDMPTLTFSEAEYWDHIDTSEALLFEAAWHWESEGAIAGPFRERLGSPFTFESRSAIPGINVLTIRRSSRQCTFYLVNRDDVATAMGTTHVIPAGEFQPSRDGRGQGVAEMRIEATMIREYAEELLDHEEARDHRMPPIDVVSDEPYRTIHHALSSGRAKAWYLGIGLYPVTWKPEILIACVFEAKTFDRIFAKMVREGREGTLVSPNGSRWPRTRFWVKGNRPYDGLPFTQEIVRFYASRLATLPAGRAALQLAWRHRNVLGLSDYSGGQDSF